MNSTVNTSLMEVTVPKAKLLINSFSTLFPGCVSDWKNSQGIFNELNRCMVKRSICYSLRPVCLDPGVFPEEFVNRFKCACVWGLCGIESTRANRATDSLFILCAKQDKHFVAVAVASFSPDLKSETRLSLAQLDTSRSNVEKLLIDMKKEKEVYSEEKWEKKRAKLCAKRKREEEGPCSSPKFKKTPKKKRARFDESNKQTPCQPPLQHPIEPLQHPIEPIQHPIEPIQHPIEPIQHPIEPIQHPIEPIQHPIEPIQHPIEPIQHPIEPIQHPIDPLQHLIDPLLFPIEPYPTEPLQCPIEPYPNESPQHPAELPCESVQPSELCGSSYYSSDESDGTETVLLDETENNPQEGFSGFTCGLDRDEEQSSSLYDEDDSASLAERFFVEDFAGGVSSELSDDSTACLGRFVVAFLGWLVLRVRTFFSDSEDSLAEESFSDESFSDESPSDESLSDESLS